MVSALAKLLRDKLTDGGLSSHGGTVEINEVKTSFCLKPIADKSVLTRRPRGRMFMKARVERDKKIEVKRSVMCDMRRLGMLFMHFPVECQQQNLVESSSPVGVRHMIRRNYYQALQRTATTAEKEEIKSGPKLGLYYLLKRLAKVVKSTYLVSDNDDDAAKVSASIFKRLAKVIKSTHLVSGNDDDAAKVYKFVDVLYLNKN